jgi:hypothetical protein
MEALCARESEALWIAAQSFDDLCRLGARFCRGEIAAFPGWMASALDDESVALAPALARLCEAGFLTLASQPGRAAHASHDGAPCVQRAFVTAFARPGTAERLVRELASSEIRVAAFAHGDRDRESAPVSTRGGVAYAFTGHNAFASELVCFEDRVSIAALRELESARYVCAHDPAWGRDDLLWRELERAVCAAHA